MNIEHIREFDVLAESLNFSKAAATLHISQSALSKHIDGLERELGVKLLTRDTHSASLTNYGRLFLSKSAVLLRDYDDLLSIGHQQELVTAAGAINNFRVLEALKKATSLGEQDEARIFLSLTGLASRNMRESLESGQLDIYVDYANALTGNRISSRHLFDDPMGVFVNRESLPDFPIKRLSDLRDYAFIHLANKELDAGWRYLASCCDREGFTPKEITKATESEMDVQFLAIQPGTCFVTAQNMYITPQLKMRDDLVFFPLEEAAFSYYIFFDSNNPKNAVRRIVDHLA